MKQSQYQLHPQQFLSSSSSFYIMLYYAVFQALKRKGSLYCCYQNSPYQLCPHILVFMFKNYTHTHTHYKNVSIILMFTYENKKYTRSSKLTMNNNKINKQIFIEFINKIIIGV